MKHMGQWKTIAEIPLPYPFMRKFDNGEKLSRQHGRLYSRTPIPRLNLLDCSSPANKRPRGAVLQPNDAKGAAAQFLSALPPLLDGRPPLSGRRVGDVLGLRGEAVADDGAVEFPVSHQVGDDFVHRWRT